MRISTLTATLTAIVTIAVCLSAGGCGQKGNLYLPSQQKKKVPTTQTPPAAPEVPAQPGTQAQPNTQAQPDTRPPA
jgi:predicted small lipoprotein YifL